MNRFSLVHLTDGALLNGLKGEEQHAVLHSVDAGAPEQDAPRKDW